MVNLNPGYAPIDLSIRKNLMHTNTSINKTSWRKTYRHIVKPKKLEVMCQVQEISLFMAHFNPFTTLLLRRSDKSSELCFGVINKYQGIAFS